MANKKFSDFTTRTDTANVDFLVGYDGSTNVKIDPANLGGGGVDAGRFNHNFNHGSNLVFLINSRLGLFTASHRSGNPFSRSYRVILPNSLAMNHSSSLGFSPHSPVSVWGTGVNAGAFLGRELIHSLRP